MALLTVTLFALSIADLACGRMVPYQYRIGSVDESLEGHIHQDAQIGDKVPKIHHEKERHWVSDMKHFLALADSMSQVAIPAANITYPSETLDVEYVVMGTHFFGVKNRFIIVVNNTDLPQPGRIEFYVVLVTKDEEKIVSNPVPFVVEIFEEFDVDEGIVEGTTIFAGALVGLVIIFAFIIPCVVRAKRRHKAGKPIFRIDSVANGIDKLKRNESKEPNWYGLNISYDYKDEVKKQTEVFARDIINVAEHTQHSHGRTQFDWLHPHYQEESRASGSTSSSDDGPIMFVCNGDVPNSVKGILKNGPRSSSVDFPDTYKQYRKFSNSSSASDSSKSPRGILKNANSRMALTIIGEKQNEKKNANTGVIIKNNVSVQYDARHNTIEIDPTVTSNGLDNAGFQSETDRF